jgi:hypothetical protein
MEELLVLKLSDMIFTEEMFLLRIRWNLGGKRVK